MDAFSDGLVGIWSAADADVRVRSHVRRKNDAGHSAFAPAVV